jgi:hypothetical protein
MRVRVRRPLGRRALGKQHERPNQFIPPLDLVRKVELQLRKISRWFHEYCVPPAPVGRPWRGIIVDVCPNAWTATCSCTRARCPACTRRGCGAIVWWREGPYCRGTGGGALEPCSVCPERTGDGQRTKEWLVRHQQELVQALQRDESTLSRGDERQEGASSSDVRWVAKYNLPHWSGRLQCTLR